MNIFDLLIVQPIFNLLIGLYSLIPGGDFGIALVIFTIFIRFCMWPLVKKQLHQVKAMRKIQPELAKLKKKAKGSKQVEGMMMMELYKKHGVNPFRSIGILLIQLPIFIALYRVIQIFTSHRDEIGKFAYNFMENIPAVKHLIENPDTFNQMFLGFIDLSKHAIGQGGVQITLVLLALAAAVTQFIMSKQTMPTTAGPKRRLRDIMAEAAEGKEADQSEMNAVVMGKMTKFLPFMMFFIMLNLPGALALYYTVSNLVAVAQQHHILKQDETELVAMANEKPATTHKKATAKARAKAAPEATTITKISAKDTTKKKG